MAFELFEIPRAAIESRGQLAFVAVLPSRAIGDVSEKPFRSATRLFEDHRELGPPHAPHSAIAEHGAGRFSHWGSTLVFSTSDGSSALDNGRTYRALLEIKRAPETGTTALEGSALVHIQNGTLNYTYKGVTCRKSPFDLSLYQLLIGTHKPKTILEFGTLAGGSALWFADQLQIHGIDGHVYSFDIAAPPALAHPKITFRTGDVLKIADYVPAAWIRSLPRPILAVEDAGHDYRMTLAVLEHLGPLMAPGEYIAVEDSVMTAMGHAHLYDGGPLRAIDEFLAAHPEFEIDRSYCDFFGRNTTWNVNGYLRRR
jgi:cephalosporin hydroxylase